jgi:uncharacterized protein (DUF4415 family)
LARIKARATRTGAFAEIPELDDAWFAQAQPHHAGRAVVGDKPPPPNRGRVVQVRLSRAVLDRFVATGRGWEERMNAALEEWIGEHPEQPA